VTNKASTSIMKKTLPAILICFSILLSCSDIIEDDIENISPNLISPADGSRNEFPIQTFSWEEIEEADFYNLQVAEPNFDNAQRIVLDSNITTNYFEYNLVPGNYQWRLRAENSGYKSKYTSCLFSVDSSYNMDDVEITLIKPLLSDTINDVTAVEFVWEKVPNATYYTIFIQAQNDDLNPTISRDHIYGTSYTSNKLLDENVDYKWKIKAVYDDGKGTIKESPFSEMARFSVRIIKKDSN